jgi:tRNA pseudouridine55 synthase
MLLIDKPAGMTSHDVVEIARRAYGERSIGHLGTLDPFATGLLVLLLGRATKLANFLETEPKVYEAAIAFGTETDTDDSTGTVVRSAPTPTRESVKKGIEALTGGILQVPPDYSAKSVAGTRAYAAARKGKPIDQQPAAVTVHDWMVQEQTEAALRATITCSGGTYIRALARDLGRATGSAAHLSALRRLRMGSLDLADAMSLDELKLASIPPQKLRVTVSDD